MVTSRQRRDRGTAAVLIICVLLFNILARVLGKALAKKMTSE